jgi:hypothetical protein
MRIDVLKTDFFKCNKCNIEKNLSEFEKYNQRSAICIKKTCKDCKIKIIQDYKKKHYELNKDRYKELHAKYRKEHDKELKEYFRQRRINESEELKEKARIRYQQNKKQINKKSLERRKNNPKEKLSHALRNRILKVLNGISKSKKTIELLGCSIEECKEHIQNKFRDQMSWKNHGTYWHIDHIIPCASFDLENEEEQKKCFHYTNLQPLTAKENLSKGKKIL